MNRDELAIEVRSVAGEGMTMTAAESVVDRLVPLIDADVRERIATEIEGERDNEPYRKQHRYGLTVAAQIARGAEQNGATNDRP